MKKIQVLTIFTSTLLSSGLNTHSMENMGGQVECKAKKHAVIINAEQVGNQSFF